MYKHRKIDHILLAVTLFAISGACLAYNIRTAESGDISVSLSELVDYDAEKASAISDYAVANIAHNDAVAAAAKPATPPTSYELLPPIITPPK